MWGCQDLQIRVSESIRRSPPSKQKLEFTILYAIFNVMKAESTEKSSSPSLLPREEVIYLLHQQVFPSKHQTVIDILEEPPRVSFQQKMVCVPCSYVHVIHQGVSLEKIQGEWMPKSRQYFYPQHICGVCYRRMERDGETKILWPQLFPKDQREVREKKLRGSDRGRPFIVGEDKHWIYWSDNIRMAQHFMVLPDHSDGWWTHYHSIIKHHPIDHPAVLL